VARVLAAIGDVLIVRTTESYTVHVVGRVSRAGQQDFSDDTNLTYEHDYGVAIARAQALAVPGRRILLHDIDTDEWSVISD
jgi:hypothetical protein